MNKPDDYLFFFNLNEPNEQFSNWYPAAFTLEGVTYSCVEQYMMAKKALMFKDLEMYAVIMNAADPLQIKAYGRLIKNFKPELWDSCKLEVVYNACFAKFAQNGDLRDLILSTGNKSFVEANPDDKIWGIAMAADNPDAADPEKWRGQNLLGNILSEVRKVLRETAVQ